MQHVAEDDNGRDRPTRLDFDGDHRGDNNWANQRKHGWRLPAVVYGAAVLTETHAFLTYTLFYPRDWTMPLCMPFVCHDNDLENVRVVVELGGSDAADRLAWMEAKAHLGFRYLPGERVELDERGHPRSRVEAYGHGIQPCEKGDAQCAPGAGRLVYVLGEQASIPPRRARGQLVPYELLSTADTLWARRGLHHAGSLWAPGETGPLWYVGRWSGRLGHPLGAAMKGLQFVHGSVRPPWGVKGGAGARGDWFLDPARTAVAERPELAATVSTDYVFNPYLDDLVAECAGDDCSQPRPPAEQRRGQTWAVFGVIGLTMLGGMRRSRKRLRSYRAGRDV